MKAMYMYMELIKKMVNCKIEELDLYGFDTSNVQDYDYILDGDIGSLVKGDKFTLKDAYEKYIENLNWKKIHSVP